MDYPKTKKRRKVYNLHGTKIVDYYQWLEDSSKADVKRWTDKQENLSLSILDSIPQRSKIIKRLSELWRYDAKGIPREVLKGRRVFFYARKKHDEKWTYYIKKGKTTKSIELLNPNKWDVTETLDFTQPSPDGKLLAFGKAKGGNENPIVSVINVQTREILKDRLKGWKQRNVSWLHDNSGFFYSSKPLNGEVKKGEEDYWEAVYFHKLGTPSSQDKKNFYHNSIKEYYHSADVTEDGKYVVFQRTTFGKSEVFYSKLGDKQLIPIATGFDSDYNVDIINKKIIIRTDSGAPNGRIFITDVTKPKRKYWEELIPETTEALLDIKCIAGLLFVKYLHKAYTKIKIYGLNGNYIRDLPLPDIGTADIDGYWSKPTVWIMFSSFTYPYTIYSYNPNKNKLKLYFKPRIKLDVSNYITEQVWYRSKDGTKISMFLIRRKDIEKNGKNPTLLSGYGGFNISMVPNYFPQYVIWLEAGGMIAKPNLRGGGEYGSKWHEAGKRENKQNVFDDFIAASEWLIQKKYTNPRNLAISGGSNGGLLVGAAIVQRPDLFRVVDCSVPLLDMIRYHKFRIANTWAIEYGSAENSREFRYLLKYSPYHNIKDGTKYPAILITMSNNDARVDPMHARKMVAKMQEANPHGEPILLLVRKDSGHLGGTTISTQIEQISDAVCFLMYKLGMKFK